MQGVLHALGSAAQQVFQRLPCSSPGNAAEAHFQHFTETVWPRLKGSGAAGEPALHVAQLQIALVVASALKQPRQCS